MKIEPYVPPYTTTESADNNTDDPEDIRKRAEGRAVREWVLKKYRVAWRALARYDEGLTTEDALEQARLEYGKVGGGDVL